MIRTYESFIDLHILILLVSLKAYLLKPMSVALAMGYQEHVWPMHAGDLQEADLPLRAAPFIELFSSGFVEEIHSI